MKTIRLAVAGVGNCASSLIQGLAYYTNTTNKPIGLMHEQIGPYRLSDIKVVAAFDVDVRKVGQPLERAMFAQPNNTTIFQREIPPSGVVVQMGPILDGIASHMASYPDSQAFRPASLPPVDLARVLTDTRADVLVCYLPVGSEQAVRRYAEACLEAKVAMVNCVPVFIASHPEWAERFSMRGIPIVGDDIKSQVGATIIHRALARLMMDRGVRVDRTYQLNTGGNTDFLNMLSQERLQSKRVSKTQSVQSQLNPPLHPDNIHVGPSDFVPWQKDNKVCFMRVEWAGFGGVPMNLEMRLSVEDSPNSAGVAVDAIRLAKVARDRGLGGPVFEASAYLMKHPPKQFTDDEARLAIDRFIAGA